VSKESSKDPHIIPRDILPDHVIGLVEAVHSLGGSVDPMYVGDITGESIEILPKAVDIAEALNLIKYKNGYLYITEFGKKVAEADVKRLRKLLREVVILNKVEPLHEIYIDLKKRKKISKEEFISIVEKYYKRIDENIIRNILVWGTYLQLFKMNEDDTEIILIQNS
jgi:hypothetical protein